MKKLSIKGIVIGSILDIVATNIVIIPVIIWIFSSHPGVSGLPPEQASKVITDALATNPFFFVSVALGSLCSVLGGYVAARIAKHDEILNGACASFICTGTGLYSLIYSASVLPLWERILLLLLGPIVCAFGGWLRLQQISKAKK